MAADKKSFVLYSDNHGLIKQLPDEVAGRLLKHIFAYVNDENPISDELLLNIAFEPIKMALKRDLRKYEQIKEKRSFAGKKSAELRQQKATNPTSVHFVQQTSTNSTDSVIVNDILLKKETKNTNSIEVRKLKFAHTLEPFLKKYGREFLNEFYKYWTEPNKSNTKFKQELEKTWSLERRLETWAKNDRNFNKKNVVQNGEPTINRQTRSVIESNSRGWEIE